MKTINKNTEKKQRVRVLETGQLGTVTDQQLSPRDGQLHRYMQVKLDGQPHLDRWFWDYQLGGTKETCRVTFEGEGSYYYLDITKDHEADNYTIEMGGRKSNPKPNNRMLELNLMRYLLIDIGVTTEDLENARPVD